MLICRGQGYRVSEYDKLGGRIRKQKNRFGGTPRAQVLDIVCVCVCVSLSLSLGECLPRGRLFFPALNIFQVCIYVYGSCTQTVINVCAQTLNCTKNMGIYVYIYMSVCVCVYMCVCVCVYINTQILFER